jgi:formylglycine-generating enzyme required for sulfatase activity
VAWQIISKTQEDIATELAAAEGLRLLTFDEWEYACGAGSTTLFHWGDFLAISTQLTI